MGKIPQGGADMFGKSEIINPKFEIIITLFVTLSLGTFVVTAAPTTAPAEAASSPATTAFSPRELAQTMAQLDSDDWALRQEATRRLLRDDTLTPRRVAELFTQARSAEQRLRLEMVAQHHFVRALAEKQQHPGAPASLGVSLEPLDAQEIAALGRPAVRVVLTLPGFPAYGEIEPGDAITALDGQGLDAGLDGEALVTQVQQMIQHHTCGQSVTVAFQRQGRSLETTVQLGDLNALRGLYGKNTDLQIGTTQEWERFRAAHLVYPPPGTPEHVVTTPLPAAE